jgi:hypothetical protein
MTFAETYREERLINRRSRSRKARIAGRIIGFGLTACLVVALRTDPQLRSMVEDLAMAAIGASGLEPAGANGTSQSAQAAGIAALGVAQNSEHQRKLEALGIAGQNGSNGQAQGLAGSNSQQQTAPITSRMPQSKVKINRPGSG